MNKKIWIGLVLFSIVTIATVSWAVVYFSSKQSESNVSETQTPSLSENSELATDWTMYQNTNANIAFSIPKEWTINEARDASNNPTGIITFLPSENAEPSAVNELLVLLNTNKDEMGLENADTAAEIAKLPTKSTEAVVFKVSQTDEAPHLVSWFSLDEKELFIETHGDVGETGLAFHAQVLKNFGTIN